MLDQKHALTVLTRLASRRPQEERKLRAALAGRLDSLAPQALNVAMETGDPIGRVLAETFETRGYDELSRSIEEQVPFETTALRELGLVLIRQRYNKEIYQKPIGSAERALFVARNITFFGHRLQAVGKLSLAPNSYLGAYEILRQLTDEAAIPVLANVLNNIALTKAELDPSEDTRDVVRMAIEHHRWSVAHGKGSELDLADSLNTLATMHLERSEWLDAVPLLEEALGIVEASPGRNTPDGRAKLARLKNNLGLALNGSGRHAKAAALFEQSVAVARVLSDTTPDVYRQFLARYLGNLAAARLATDDIAGARQDIAESLLIWKELSDRRPDAFAEDYLKALQVKSSIESAEGVEVSADELSDELIMERLSGAPAEPDRWKQWLKRIIRPKIGRALHREDWTAIANLSDKEIAATRDPSGADEEEAVGLAMNYMVKAIAKRRAGHLKEAIAALGQALAIAPRTGSEDTKLLRARLLRHQASFLAEDQQADLAASLFFAAYTSYGEIAAREERAETAAWAVDFLGEAAAKQDWIATEFEARMRSLENARNEESARASAYVALLAAWKGEKSQLCIALRTCREGVETVRSRNASTEIAVHSPLTKISRILEDAGKADEAIGVEELAVAALGLEAHLNTNDAYAERVFDSLLKVARMHSGQRNAAGEIGTLTRFVELSDARIAALGKPPSTRLAQALDRLSLLLKRSGDFDRALKLAQEAVSAYKSWFDREPARARIPYAGGLNNFSNRLWEAGRKEESLAAIAQAFDVLEPVIEDSDPDLREVVGSLIGAYIPRSAELRQHSSAIDKLFERFVSSRRR